METKPSQVQPTYQAWNGVALQAGSNPAVSNLGYYTQELEEVGLLGNLKIHDTQE